MYIAIRKDLNGKIHIDKFLFRHRDVNDLTGSLYSKVEIPDDTFDYVSHMDFNDDLTFNQEKFEARIQREEDFRNLSKLKERLKELSDDMVQIQCGAVFEDKDDRIAEFREVHNEIRKIIGKEPRVYL